MTDEKNVGTAPASQGQPQNAPAPLIEGPSATNSPDNSNSGAAAYVIFGVALAIVVLLLGSVVSCTSGVIQLALSDYGYGYGYGDGYGYFDDEDLHDMVQELLGDSATSGTSFIS